MERQMIKLVSLLTLLTTPAMAGMSTYYDGSGQPIGSAITSGNNTFYYDNSGQSIGSAMQSGNNTYYYDNQGNTAASRMDLNIGNQ